MDLPLNYGKVKLVLKKNRYFVESPFPDVLKTLLRDDVISRARIFPSEESNGGNAFTISKTAGDLGGGHEGLLDESDLAAAAEEKETHSFEIDPSQVENVNQCCLPSALNYPMLEEYDFRNDSESNGGNAFTISKTAGDLGGGHEGLLDESDLAAAAEEKETHSFEIDPSQVENVKQRCLPSALNYPMLEEYDLRNDSGRLQDRMAGGKEEYNAFFYSLVSTDTQEMYYSTKRQQFLIDQGYSFKVITSLPPPDSGPELSFYELKDQLDLLNKVLSAGDSDVGLEMLEEDTDGLALLKARRFAGSMSAMSGASGRIYMEYSTGKFKHGSQVKSKPKDPSKRHVLFRKRFQ